MWLKDHGIKAFFTASQNKSFSDGAISCMNLAGLGKLTPNMVLMGFKVQIWHQSVFYLCLTVKDCFSPFFWFMIRYEMPCVLLQADWASDPEGAEEYINVMHHAFDINMAMGVLR